jgi:hypothetical protein
VREAIEQQDWGTTDREIARLSSAIERAAGHVSAIAALLEGGR